MSSFPRNLIYFKRQVFLFPPSSSPRLLHHLIAMHSSNNAWWDSAFGKLIFSRVKLANWTEFKSFFDWFSLWRMRDKKIYSNCLATLTTSDTRALTWSLVDFSRCHQKGMREKMWEKSSSWCDNLLVQKVD